MNQSVSRRHAHISYEPLTRSFRLDDDGSEHGTSIVRPGRSFTVPRGARGAPASNQQTRSFLVTRGCVTFGPTVVRDTPVHDNGS